MSINIISKTVTFVKNITAGDSGHDWLHVKRVWLMARHLAKNYPKPTNMLVVDLGALLHDVADAKFYQGDENIGPKKARDFLKSIDVEADIITCVEAIIRNVSYRHTLEPNKEVFTSTELQIIQDADRLDAMGAIGIARAFNYGGYKNRALYNPKIPANPKLTKEAYQHNNAPTLNHFYEKLLLLKDLMHTDTAKLIAEERHNFMIAYLEQFKKETELYDIDETDLF